MTSEQRLWQAVLGQAISDAVMEDPQTLKSMMAKKSAEASLLKAEAAKRREKDLKAKLLGLAKDNEEVRLPYGIKLKVVQQQRGGHVVGSFDDDNDGGVGRGRRPQQPRQLGRRHDG